MTYNKYDIVKLPFPFTDKLSSKRRPALIVSNKVYNTNCNHYILCMITSAKHSDWIDDIEIINLNKTGLTTPSKIRFKIFSIQKSLIISKLGFLQKEDVENFNLNLKKYIF